MNDPVTKPKFPVLESEGLCMWIKSLPQKRIQCINTENGLTERGEDLDIVNFKITASEQSLYRVKNCL